MTEFYLLLQFFVVIILITTIYRSGRLAWALKWGIHHKHYFLGFGRKLFTISVKGVKFSYGFSIPFFGKRHVYNFENGQKEHGNMPWEFYEFPKRQRLITTLGGVFLLTMLGILLFIILSYTETISFISKEEVNKHGIYPTELSSEAGFKINDKIVTYNGKDYDDFYNLINPVEGCTYEVIRNGKKLSISISKEIVALQRFYGEPFFYLNVPFTIDQVEESMPAYKAGLKSGDRIKSVNGVQIIKLFELKNELAKDSDGESLLEIERTERHNKKTFLVNIRPTKEYLLGFIPNEQLNYSSKRRSIWEAIVDGTTTSFKIIYFNTYGFYRISRIDAVKSERGPIGISQNYEEFNLKRFWFITAMLFMFTTFYNILPLPGSAFWEVVPLAYETMFKKRYSFNQYMSTRKLGIWMIIGLIILSFVNDLMKILN